MPSDPSPPNRTKVEGIVFQWQVSQLPFAGGEWAYRLLVTSADNCVTPLRCAFSHPDEVCPITGDRIGAIIQFALLTGWDPTGEKAKEEELDQDLINDLLANADSSGDSPGLEDLMGDLEDSADSQDDEESSEEEPSRPPRKPQELSPDPFVDQGDDPVNHFTFPSQIADFFMDEVTMVAHGDLFCPCKACSYMIHNNRCDKCGNLMRTHKAKQCLAC